MFDPSPEMCIRCQKIEAPQPLGYCAACAVNARLEAMDGLRRLTAYLSAWAAFDAWLSERGLGAS